MSESAKRTVTARFEITRWDVAPYDETLEGLKLTRGTVGKRFTGPLEGTSLTELLTAQAPDGSGYVASERVTGTLEGRTGTFVLQHGGVGDARSQRAFGHIVPGTGTGELKGLVGEVSYRHEGNVAELTMTYSLP